MNQLASVGNRLCTSGVSGFESQHMHLSKNGQQMKQLPSGKVTVCYGKSPSLVGKSTINGPRNGWYGGTPDGETLTHPPLKTLRPWANGFSLGSNVLAGHFWREKWGIKDFVRQKWVVNVIKPWKTCAKKDMISSTQHETAYQNKFCTWDLARMLMCRSRMVIWPPILLGVGIWWDKQS